ncbi:MAG: methionyl-tRNA formyltransferase [Bacillus subtilis]|nr:methionyl-tRNA formyltransferase [Bacillus subtilis]
MPILEALHRQYTISLVVTQPDRPFGRKQVLKPTPVKEFAVTHQLPIFQPEKIRVDYHPILASKPDVIVVAAYGQMIPQVILDAPQFKAINVHASLLPKYRGGAPMHKAIQYGEDVTGVTVMFMAMKMDSGPVLSQASLPIELTDTVGTLQTKLAKLGADLLLETLPAVFAKTIVPIPQDESRVTFAYNIKPEEEILRWNQSMKAVYDHVRGYHPWPIVHSSIDGMAFKIHEVEMVFADIDRYQGANYGEIVKIVKNEVYVLVTDGLIRLKTIQPAGKAVMAASSYLNGNGREILKIGKIFAD